MPYRFWAYLLLILFLTAFKTKNYQVAGYLDDVSPNRQYILYEAPEVWETDEYRFGNLQVMDMRTGELTIIPDQVLIEESGSFFLNDSIVAMQPGGGRVALYNLQTKSFEKAPLLTYDEHFIPLQFALSEDKLKAALILLDNRTTWQDQDPSKEPTCRVALQVVDLTNSKAYRVEHEDYRLGTDIHSGVILWHQDKVIYGYQDNLYCYQLGQSKSRCIVNYIPGLALHDDSLLFDGYPVLQQFDFDDQSVKPFKVKNQPSYSRQAWQKLYTIHYYGSKRAALRIEDQGKYDYYMINENHECIQQDKPLIYQDKNLCIQEWIVELANDHSTVYKTKKQGLLLTRNCAN